MIWLVTALSMILALVSYNCWSNSRELARLHHRIADLHHRITDNDRDLTALAKAVRRLEYMPDYASADHLAKKKPLTVKKPRRRTPPSR